MAHVYLSADAHGCPPWQHCVGVCISWTYWSQRISAAFLFFQSDPLRLNAALSLSLPLRLYLSRSERKRDRNTWTRVRLRRCLQAWVSNPPLSSGCLFKMKEVFFFFSKSAFLLCDLWVWHKLNWSYHSIYNAGFYEKLPLKPKGGKNLVPCVNRQKNNIQTP